MVFVLSFLMRVYNFANCPRRKSVVNSLHVLCSKKGNQTIESVVLNRVCSLRNFFCPRQSQGFKLLAAHLYGHKLNIGQVHIPPPGTCLS